MKQQVTFGDYELFVESGPSQPQSDTMVRIWSKWNSAKNPEDMQRKFEHIFSIDDLDRLIDVLVDTRDQAVVRTAVHKDPVL